ncbi:MAG: hypothetical protein IJ688_14770 [Treponema sp.]|nr:hypothetical protein [Treponema sp.]
MNKNIFSHKPNKNKYSEDDKIKFKKPVYVRDDLGTLNRLFKSYSNANRNNNLRTKLSGGVRGSAFKFSEHNQRVTFKMSYSNSMKSHDQYIKYYMPQHNKDYVEEKPELFGMCEDEYEKYKVPLNFKCIISPESNNINLETLAESFIKRVENQTGYKLCWRGAIHNDTDHRHAHIVINGRDMNGEDVFFNKDTIQLMRLMCSNAATQMIGERTKEQIEAARKNLVKAKRWTELDEKILSASSLKDGILFANNLPVELVNRLSYLSDLHLAEYDKENKSWKFSENYKTVLTASGRYNTYLEEYAKNPEEPLELYTGGGVKGKVEKVITFDKDESWNDAIIINTGEKRVYVPVWQLHKGDLVGKNVTIRKSGDDTKIARQVSDKNIIVRA